MYCCIILAITSVIRRKTNFLFKLDQSVAIHSFLHVNAPFSEGCNLWLNKLIMELKCVCQSAQNIQILYRFPITGLRVTSLMNVTYQDGLYTLSAGVSVSMPLQSSAARDLPWSECSLITTVWTGPVLRHLLIRDNTNSKVAGILMPRLGFEPTLLVICGRRQLG